MALAYTEGKSLAVNLHADLRTAILASTDWTRNTSDSVILTTTTSTAIAGVTLTFASGAPAAAGIAVGSMIRIDSGANKAEYRTVTAFTATTITVAAMTFAHGIGTNIYWGSEAYKATTTRGATMMFDLADGPISTTTSLQITAYSEDLGGLAQNNPRMGTRYLTFKGANSGAVTTNFVYWTVSVSKEHVFIMLEGPRAGETGADSASYGSVRTYMYMSDLVPYFSSGVDPTPVAVLGMSGDATYKTTTGPYSHKPAVTRNIAGNKNWNWGVLTTLEVPGLTGPYQANRFAPDGNLFLSPYVYFDDEDGMRGRLSSLFYVGPTSSSGDYASPEETVAPNSFTTYAGIKYKILAVNRNNTLNGGAIFGSLGGFTANSGLPGSFQSPLVAVPFSVV